MTPSLQCPAPVLRPGAQGIARVAVDDVTAQLTVTFHRPVTQAYLLNPRSYTLTGGQRLFPRVLEANPVGGMSVLLTLDQTGDFSIYTLTVSGADIDPFFSSYKLRFRLACDDPFDCRIPTALPPPAEELPVHIDYLAKDYSSFRQALLDFIPARMPQWTERNEADIGMMLLELFAATADSLSYMQDRVANEAFLTSASQRRSVAGHLALIGYELDPGESARTWLYLEVNSEQTLASNAAFPVSNTPRRGDEPLIIFETISEAHLTPEFNSMSVYTWGNPDCCVPRDALNTELEGDFGDLRAGDYLLLDDQNGHRDIVQLTADAAVTAGPITTVAWSSATPLRFEYCASRTIVRGNLVVATHGGTVAEETLDASRRLDRAPLAYVDGESTLVVRVDGVAWEQRSTLLESGPDDRVFRVEIDDEGEATVIFGNGTFGMSPPKTSKITATYRVGGGLAGNVGADVLTLPRVPAPWLRSITNPLPATGGRDFETGDHARRVAPAIFRKPLIAVTAADYQTIAQDFTDSSGNRPIQRASADFRWTGSWLTVTLAADPTSTEGLAPELGEALLEFLDTRRLAGYDLSITRPIYVPVELALEFCVLPGFLAADVEQGLVEVFREFFSPDHFSFGESLYVSRIYSTAMTVPGIESATITTIARLRAMRPDRETTENLARGFLAVSADQIIRLDNDRNFPENGVLILRSAGVGA